MDSTILNGLLRSQNFASVAASIPCDIVNELENNAEAAEQFVREIQAGQVPTIIADLPEEIVNAFGSIVSVALSLPQSIWNTAVNVVDGVEDVFDSIAEGSIVSELPKEIADEWEDVTAGFVDAWDQATADIACFFGDCAKPTRGACDSSAVPMSAYASATPVVHYNTIPAAYSYSWALSSAVVAASVAAYAQATASDTALHPAAVGTSIVYGPTNSAQPSSYESLQPSTDGAVGHAQAHGLIWAVAGLVVVGGLVIWL